MARDRMTPEQRAAAKAKAQAANDLDRLARTALGDNATSVEQRKAQAALERQVGRRKAEQLKERELRRAGAKAKGLGRWFG
ncbi:hypothetical protein [Sphaerimonospora thailandensis]|uniref:Uncharacterized protein n=1 Tax=Sphaerimonospora thailandensis TaxID=795644 RepID=A0A8J3VYW6_9ACTN|nr:hypothetical protein [Sphaerimonospora thailandensis]GIH69423.1 hypothetical protein Mth01_16760 [Sphaerimonospora thailandensis]